jgi:arylsulfatase A-like enzyme
MYEPVIRIPLLISPPGRQARRDIFTPTSNIDVLPTLLHRAGIDVPDWCEGSVLPGLGGQADESRSVISVEAKENTADRPLSKATIALIRGRYKLIYYTGYKGKYQNYFEFYDLEEDPEELHDLVGRARVQAIRSDMQNELADRLSAADRPYERAA